MMQGENWLGYTRIFSFVLALVIPIVVFNNWYLYRKVGVEQIMVEWKDQPQKTKRRWGPGALLYFVVVEVYFILGLPSSK